MKFSILILLVILVTFSLGGAPFGKPHTQVNVHILGEVKKPGKYKINSAYDLTNIKKNVGGITAFGDTTAIYIIRFQRKEGHINSWSKYPSKDEVINLSEALKLNKKFKLLEGDLIYFPMKKVTAR